MVETSEMCQWVKMVDIELKKKKKRFKLSLILIVYSLSDCIAKNRLKATE